MSSPRTDDLAAWDNVASEYAEQPGVDWFDGFIDRHLGDVAGKRILDLGCGHGWFTNELHARGPTSSVSTAAIASSTSPAAGIHTPTSSSPIFATATRVTSMRSWR